MTEFFNRSEERGARRRLRQEMPRAEALLWSRLRARQVSGRKFRRQYSVGPFVVDFYCAEVKLAVEVDGDTHFSPGAKLRDAERQSFIASFGIRFLRFTNADIYENLDGVIERIAREVGEPSIGP